MATAPLNGRQRFVQAITFREPDRPPHFEEIFELTEEAFGRRFPPGEAIAAASGAGRERLLNECVTLYGQIVERFRWDALTIWHPWGGQDMLDCLRLAKRELGRKIMVGAYIGGSIHAIDTVRDFMQFSVDLHENPGLLHEQARRMSDEALALGRAIREAGGDFVNLVSDVAYNQGPFISPAMFREFIIPYMHRHIPALKAEGLWVIQHSDGNLMPVLEDWISPGMHMLHSLDPMAGMDMAEVKRATWKRVALMGNVQCSLLQDGPDDAIRQSARYALTHGAPGGGYFFSTSNTIFSGMPLRHYEDVMLDEFRRWQGERSACAPCAGTILNERE
ncbi:MAG: methylcobalamin:coenzyme M methyltransferase [Lentisphaerae bacterium ADurb.BinA184]|nr:MAG: methylcobalamin:coenzyme M methyltransferase [Lentisphaerae bacterium ADurb.BinA184]